MSWVRLRRSTALASGVALILGMLGGCASGGQAIDNIRDRGDVGSRSRSYGTWEELVALAERGESPPGPIRVAVVGDVLRVAEGRSFTWKLDANGENEQRLETPFGSDEAMVSTYHLTVRVASVVGDPASSLAEGAEIQVGITVDPDVSLGEVQKDFGPLRGGVFFLKESPVYDYEEGLLAIAEDGALVAFPDERGHLTFPMLDEKDSVQPPAETTVADLEPSLR